MSKGKYVNGNYFYGNEISEYGKKNGRVDYRTLAKAFDAVYTGDIISRTSEFFGEWELENGSFYMCCDTDGEEYTEAEAEELIDGLRDKLDELETEKLGTPEDEVNNAEEIAEIEERIKRLEDIHTQEVFQWYIISDSGAELLKEWTEEIVFYNAELDMYVWGVTHWGTSWDYVLTDIRCGVEAN